MACHDNGTRLHRFVDHQPPRLAQARQYHDLGLCKFPCQIYTFLVADERDHFADPGLLCQRQQGRLFGAEADEPQFRRAAKMGKGTNCRRNSLFRAQASDIDQSRLAITNYLTFPPASGPG